MPPCLTLNIIRYITRVKWSNSGEWVMPSPTPGCSSYWKREPSGCPQLQSPTLHVAIYFYNVDLELLNIMKNNPNSYQFYLVTITFSTGIPHKMILNVWLDIIFIIRIPMLFHIYFSFCWVFSLTSDVSCKFICQISYFISSEFDSLFFKVQKEKGKWHIISPTSNLFHYELF